jgi:adenylate kinase family enzyme
MFNVCPNCGELRADKAVVTDGGSYAVCPVCEHRHPFVRRPLFIITGASGVGKTTVCLGLVAKTKEFVVLDSDILWRNEFQQPEREYREYREMWLRVCKNISQAEKAVMLCGAGVPAQFEQCVERRYFSAIHYLALVCEDKVLASRLRSRPAWRASDSGEGEYIERHVAYNRWLKENAHTTQPPMTLIDTTDIAVDETVEEILRWARALSVNG